MVLLLVKKKVPQSHLKTFDGHKQGARLKNTASAGAAAVLLQLSDTFFLVWSAGLVLTSRGTSGFDLDVICRLGVVSSAELLQSLQNWIPAGLCFNV